MTLEDQKITKRISVVTGHPPTNQRSSARTRSYHETVHARIRRDPEFARLLCGEAVNAILDGEADVGLSVLRDLIAAEGTCHPWPRFVEV